MANIAGSVGVIGDFNRFIELGRVMPAEPVDNLVNNYNGSTSFFDRIINQTKPDNSNVNQIPELPVLICYPEKLVREAVSMFACRFHMHQRVYTHKAAKQVEFMITDALELADPYIIISGTKTQERPDGLYKMSETIYDMEAL